MVELKGLTPEKLSELYARCQDLREQVNEIVNEYGYTANDLTTRKFEQDLEREYGKKILKEICKFADRVLDQSAQKENR